MNLHAPKFVALTVLELAVLLVPRTSWAQPSDADKDKRCGLHPRIIVYDFRDHSLRWEGCSKPPTTQLNVGDPIDLKITHVNPYRHAVSAKIDQQTFDELFKVEGLISSNLLPKQEAPKTSPTGGGKPGAVEAQQNAEAEVIAKASAFEDSVNRLTALDEEAAQQNLIALLTEDPDALKNESAALAKAVIKATASLPAPPPTPEGLWTLRSTVAATVDKAFDALTNAFDALKKAQTTLPIEVVERVRNADGAHQQLIDTKARRDQQFVTSITIYANVLDSGFGSVLVGPVAATGDEIDITVEAPLTSAATNISVSPAAGATPGDASAGSSTKSKADTTKAQPLLVIPVVLNRRPSFSTGIFFTNLVSPTFFKAADGTARMNSNDHFTTALGAMVHTPLWFPTPNVTVQLSLGVALKDTNPLYALGPSVIVGRRQRTVITAGIAGGQVNQLSGVKLGETVSGAQPTTVKVFRTNFFLAFTYNFGPTAATTSPNK